ncbi:MAG: hypothetical protein ACUVX8_00695 [Candidatus Zipacnadales bacterium]
MLHRLKGAVLFTTSMLGCSTLSAQEGITPERVAEIAAMLPAKPIGVGAPVDDRAIWEALATEEAFRNVIPTAEKLLDQPIPEQPDDLYLDFSRTGNRTRWQRVAGQRRGRVDDLVLAECLENKGRFLRPFEEIVAALCAERTWVMPAHDGRLQNFEGKTIDIDLASASLGWSLATADYLLGERLSAETRQLLRDNVRRRVLDPYLAMVRGERPANWWMKTTNNWNAVCLGGVTGAGLALAEDVQERVLFVAAAEYYSRNFLHGFTADGYCSEGTGYWNYGFGYYVLLAETIYQATNGGVDLFAREEVRAPAQYGARIEIINGVCPAFADCSINARPSSRIMWFVNRRYGLGLPDYEQQPIGPGTLYEAMIYSLPNSASKSPEVKSTSTGPGLRTWFDQAGILIGRPVPSTSCRLGVALKGGHNAEHHNHNDVGSYVVVVGERAILLDPGAETYTARTFSSRRYESNVLNSYGHPVPLVAGTLQRTGREAAAKVLATEFTDTTDTLKLDLAAAYAVPALKTLERTFVYSREDTGSLTVTDHVVFSEPMDFGTALITMGQFHQVAADELNIYDFDEAVRVKIFSTATYRVQPEEIHEETPRVPTRIGLNLAEPTTEATISVTITPLALEDERLVKNEDFEHGAWGWSINDKMTRISEERAYSGRFSMKIVDTETTNGSNTTSARLPLAAKRKYMLTGQVFPVSGNGLGLYIKYYDAQGTQLNETDERGWISAIGSLGGESKRWEPFRFPFETPPGTEYVQIWIHSANSAVVEAYLDDLEVTDTQ